MRVKAMWNGQVVTTLFDLDQLTVRATAQSVVLRSRDYDLLDGAGGSVGDAVQRTDGPIDAVRRAASPTHRSMSASFVVHDRVGGVALTVLKRPTGRLFPKVQIEAALANDAVVAVVRSLGRSLGEYDIADPQGIAVATLRRGSGVLFAIADGAGQPAGSVALDANTLSARRAGTAHPHSYMLSFAPTAGILLRIGTLAAVLGFDSTRVQ
jgi:hypothetical protein